MPSGEELLERMRRTKTGHADRDFFRVLEYYGYNLARHARHGAIYRHPRLAQHPDPNVRQLMIPKGRSLPDYVAGKVVASIDALMQLENMEKS